jgi:ribose transport system substrate-binding protein
MKTPVLAAAAAAVSAVLFAPLPATAQSQAELIEPIEGPLTFVFIPKVIHPWYDVVAEGAQHAVEEFKDLGIEIEVIWDQPPQADVADQNRRIEGTSAAGRTGSRLPASIRRRTFRCSARHAMRASTC